LPALEIVSVMGVGYDGVDVARPRHAVLTPSTSAGKLTVWWVKGFYKAEDDALFAAIKKFEAKNKGVKIELSQYPIQDMIPKTVAALDSGSPPDVAYADSYDFQVTAKWAYDGKLEDISSVIDPLRAKFEPRALSTTFLLNNDANGRRAPTTPSR
jgi:multiple sugar transport system substrate-binding protein